MKYKLLNAFVGSGIETQASYLITEITKLSLNSVNFSYTSVLTP